MRWIHIDCAGRFNVYKVVSDTATRKHQVMYDAVLDNGEPQVAIDRNIREFLNRLPHLGDQEPK